MKHLKQKHQKIITFLLWSLWLPIILFTTHLVVDSQASSIFSYLILYAILLAILLIVGKISKELEKNNTLKACITKQFLYGFLTPALLITIPITVYSKPFQFGSQLLVVVVFLYIANLFYLVVHLDRRLYMAVHQVLEERSFHDKVVVYHKGAYAPINLKEIALIDQRNQVNWLITFKEEKHILDLPLKEIREILGTKNFFKINRNQIVHRDTIDRYRSGTFGKIELFLNVNGIQATVSKGLAAEFRKWFNS